MTTFFHFSQIVFFLLSPDDNVLSNKELERIQDLAYFSFNICLGCSKEPSHSDDSIEYSQHILYPIMSGRIFLG